MKLKLNTGHDDNEVGSSIGRSISDVSTTRSFLSPAYEHPLQDTLEPLSPSSFGEERNLGRRRSESPMMYSSAYLTVSFNFHFFTFIYIFFYYFIKY